MKFARAHSAARTAEDATKSAQAAQKAATAKPGTRQRATPTDAAGSEPRTKTANLVALLLRPSGATLKELQQASGWQAHSVRGFLSATVTRKMGLKLRSTRTESVRYSIKRKKTP